MRLSLGTLLAFAMGAAALVACEKGPSITLTPDDDDGGGSSSSGEAGSTGTAGMGGEGGMSSSGGAKAMFVEQVFPAINTACGSCHSGAELAGAAPLFWAASADASYTAIVGYAPSLIAVPDNSNLVLHGAHTGPALTAGQMTTVRAWLELEAEERGLVGGGDDPTPPPTETLAGALEEFGNCMNLEDWISTGMPSVANAQSAAGSCLGCHSSGEAGAWLSAQEEETFQMNRDFPYVKKLVSGTVDENGAFAGLVEARRFINKGLEAGNCNPQIDNCHPVYSMPPPQIAAIEDFVDLTLARMAAGNCPTQ